MLHLRLILVALVVIAVGYFIWDYTSTKIENDRLTAELKAANETIDKLDLKVEAELGISNERDRKIRSIRNAPDSDDGPVAPVLYRTIMQLSDDSE